MHRPYAMFPMILVSLSAMGQINYATTLVNPFVGTGGHGHTFPGACVPNGLVQLSPDTRPDGMMDWDGCGGYHHSDSVIYGFSHTHLSGTGVADLCDVLITPVSGTGGMAFDGSATRSRFNHSSEEASAGYYKVDLLGTPPSAADQSSIQTARPTRIPDPSIRAELTSTARVGVHRYLFPEGQAARIVLNLSHRDELLGFEIRKTSESEVVGERRSSSWAKDQRLFFCIRFSSPIQGEDVLPSNLVGRGAGYSFGELEKPLLVKVGISAVSIEGARANLDAEVPGWDFDAVRKQAEDAWNAKLGKIQVEGGTKEQQRIFYTALYHCYVAPYVFNDVDGNYRGMDGQVHHADHNVYTVFSLWDTYRALHPLMTILEPEMTSDFIKTFLLHYQQGGRLPVWELWGNETDCMIGYHSVSVIADAYMKGIRGFDADLALKAMVASATANEPGLNAYSSKGYISSEDQSESVSKTLEYAYDDWCIAQFMNKSGWDLEEDRWMDPEEYLVRSSNYQNLYDPGTGFFRPRYNGGWKRSFDPAEVNFDLTEANSWQYSLFAPQDISSLIGMHGGYDGFENHLDRLFTTSSETTGREQADITGMIGQYAHGNEPSHHMAFLYNYAGRPWKAQQVIDRVRNELYRDAPDGLSGNEDCGQMSAWYVFSAMGLYPVSPGSPEYALCVPLFDKVSVALSGGQKFDITLDPTHMDQRALTEIKVAGVPINKPFLQHDQLLKGGTLAMTTGGPDERWVTGTQDHVRADLFTYGLTTPLITAKSVSFTDTLEITLSSNDAYDAIFYALEKYPIWSDTSWHRYEHPLVVRQSAEIAAMIRTEEDHGSHIATAHFTKVDGDRSITVESKYANQYSAGGDQALVDGLRGGPDFRTGEWQGFQGQDVLATIDLGALKDITSAGLSVLQDQRSWIWYPQEVQFIFSKNGRQWSQVTVKNDTPRDAMEAMTTVLGTGPITKRARYVKVIAKNAGSCPDWHPGKGGPTWIFADEVLIDTK